MIVIITSAPSKKEESYKSSSSAPDISVDIGLFFKESDISVPLMRVFRFSTFALSFENRVSKRIFTTD